jgi:hypothetical protein
LQKNSINAEKCRKIPLMQKNSINSKKNSLCRKIPLMQKNAEKFQNCRKIPLMQKNSIDTSIDTEKAEKFHYECFVIQACVVVTPRK